MNDSWHAVSGWRRLATIYPRLAKPEHCLTNRYDHCAVTTLVVCKIRCIGTVGCCCRSCWMMNEAFTTLDEMCCKTIDVYSPRQETQTNTLKSVVASSTSSRCSLKLSWRLIALVSIFHPFVSTSTPTLLELNSENFRNCCCFNGAVDFEPHKGVYTRQTEP